MHDESWSRRRDLSRLVLMVKEPTTLFVYWELNQEKKRLVSRHFQADYGHLPFYLQLYDVTDIQFNGDNAHTARQTSVFPDSDNWYLHGVAPQRRYLIDFGTTTIHGQFFALLRSNIVETPPDKNARQPSTNVTFRPLHRTVQGEAVTGSTDSVCVPDREKQIAVVQVPYEDTFDGYSAIVKTGGEQ